MASASSSTTILALSKSLTAQCQLSSQRVPFSLVKPFSLSKPDFGSLTRSLNFSPCHFPSTRPSFFQPSKFSDSEAIVVETESATTEATAEVEPKPEAAQTVEVSKEEPKREEVFAVVMVGGRQYIVIPGRFLYVQRLKGAKVNDKITLNKVLLVGTRTRTYVGKPVVTNATVHAIVEEQGLNPKVIVFKYKKKKNYRRNIGHRQPNSRIRITGITGYEEFPCVTLDSLD
ncbi:hypothetical protein K2173_015144 [Erythroxylum novogranatense]|uniref:50S ribosomal protein L21, chloroplastic n=1 Tax=Erythroxylum novogranatense TaxID=1862640 RepID=A0AAV8T133_9ROSI|nr:hypothetical protein K2173_015144 [Erythroxylum novogranatense]